MQDIARIVEETRVEEIEISVSDKRFSLNLMELLSQVD